MENKNINQPMPYKILLIVCVSSFLIPFMGSAFNLTLPDIAKAYSFNAVTLTWVSTGYLITTAIFQIPFARFADMVGRKKIFMIGLLGLTVTTFISPLAPNGYLFIILRALAGLFSAMMFGTSMAILMSTVPPSGRAKALAINTASVYAALAVGPFAGGLLTHYGGWQSIFYVSAAMTLGVYVMSLVFMKGEWIEAKGEKFDYIGSIIYSIGIVGVIYGFTSLPHMRGWTCLLAGFAAFILFAMYEKKAASPVLDVKLFATNRVFTLASLAALINYSANSATAFMLSLYLQYIKGFDPRTAGIILISQAFVQVMASLWSGRLSSKYSPSNLATIGMIVSVIGLAGLIFVGLSTHVVFIIACLAVLGMGFGLFSSPNINVIMSSVEKKYYGQASATTGTVRLTGQAFSMGIAAMAIAIQMGSNKIVPELYPQFMHSFRITFIIFTAISVVGVYASAAKNRYMKPGKNS